MTPPELSKSRRMALRRQVPLLVVTLAFFASRGIYYWGFGVRFDEYGIDFACQTLDLELLRHDLLRNVFYLHHQAPLWNLMIGVVLKLFPVRHAAAFAVIHVSLGYGLAISLLSILRSVGVGPLARTILTIAFSASPPVIAYEWWINYHYLGAPLCAMSLAALGAFLRTEKKGWGHAAFWLFFMVTLARSVFGIVWLAGIVVMLLLTRPVPRRLILRVAALPLFLVVLNTVKTPLQTGRSFGHALLAPNLVLKMLHELPASTTDSLFAEGKLAPLSRHDPFVVPSTIPGLALDLPKTGIPGLDQERKQNGQANANCLQHVYLGDIYMKDAKWLILHYPVVYLGSVWSALSVGIMKASTDVDVLPGTKPFRATASVQEPFTKLFIVEKANGRLWALTIGLPLSLLYGLLWLLGPKARLPSSRTHTPMIFVMVLTICNVLVTTLLSWGDFSRYRFDVDAYFLVLFALFAQRTAARARSSIDLLRDALLRVRGRLRERSALGA